MRTKTNNTEPCISEDALWHLQKSDGYMDLGLLDRARHELTRIPDRDHATPEYRKIRLRLAISEQDWPFAAMLARAVHSCEPHDSSHWLQLAYVVRRFRDIESARSILQEAYTRFPNEPLIPFNLACYACVMGDQNKALGYLETAFRIDPTCKRLAMSDQDLKPLWEDLEVEMS